VRFQNVFGSKTFDAHVIDSGEDTSLRSFTYPGALEDRWVKGTSVRVEPQGAGPWMGHFLAGRESPNAVTLACDHPDEQHLVVVSDGAGYIVSAASPKDWREIPLRPIMGYCVARDRGVLVLFDYVRLIGIARDGATWHTPSLSWDGLRNVQCSGGKVTGQGWDAANSKFVGFEVDVISGKSSGGTSPPV
jgi:hypothetical protein